jgi:hypothetical protein
MKQVKKTIQVMLMVMILIIGSIGMGTPIESQVENAWVLVRVIDHPNNEGWKSANAHESYDNQVTYNQSNFSVKSTYIGDSQGTKVKGEGVRLSAVFSGAPEIIYKGQEVSLTLNLQASENTLSFFTFSAFASADFYPNVDIAPGMGIGTRFVDTDKNSSWTIGGSYDSTSYNPIRKTIKATAPTGSNTGDQIVLRQYFYRGVSMSTYYVYEWKAPGGGSPSIPPSNQTSAFSDLPTSHWAYENIMEMVALGILDGYADGSFQPNKTISRAEFAKILVLSLQLPATNPITSAFSDVPPNHWAYQVVESSKNYLTGYRNSSGIMSFEPNAVAVREDVAVAIVKAKGLANTRANLNYLNQFSDQSQISTALRNHIAIAVEQEYMKGTNRGFEPQKALTRAEACALLSRLINRSQFEGREKVPYN